MTIAHRGRWLILGAAIEAPERIAELVDVPVRRIRASIKAGSIPGVQLGGRHMVPTAALI